MHSVWVEVEVLPQQREEFLRAIAINAAHSVSDEPGCLFFDVIELDPEAGRYAFYEIYRDRNAFLVEHRSSARYARWREVSSVVVRPGSHINKEGTRILGTSLEPGPPAAHSRTIPKRS